MSFSIMEQLARGALIWDKLGLTQQEVQRMEEIILMTDSITQPKDMVNHPPHYRAHPSGIEHIEVTEHFNFCRGTVIKYIWRAGLKGGPEQEIEDLKKARWYLDREIQRLEKAQRSGA